MCIPILAFQGQRTRNTLHATQLYKARKKKAKNVRSMKHMKGNSRTNADFVFLSKVYRQKGGCERFWDRKWM